MSSSNFGRGIFILPVVSTFWWGKVTLLWIWGIVFRRYYIPVNITLWAGALLERESPKGHFKEPVTQRRAGWIMTETPLQSQHFQSISETVIIYRFQQNGHTLPPCCGVEHVDLNEWRGKRKKLIAPVHLNRRLVDTSNTQVEWRPTCRKS